MKEWQAEISERDLEGLGDILKVHGWEVLPPFYRIAMGDDGPVKFPIVDKPSSKWVGGGALPDLSQLEWIEVYQTDFWLTNHTKWKVCHIDRKDMGTTSLGPRLVFEPNDPRVTKQTHMRFRFDPATLFFEADIWADAPGDSFCILKIDFKFKGIDKLIRYDEYTSPSFGFIHSQNRTMLRGNVGDNEEFRKPSPPPIVDLDNVALAPATFAVAKHQLFRHPSGQLYGLATVRKHQFDADYMKEAVHPVIPSPIDIKGEPILTASPKGMSNLRSSLLQFADFALQTDERYKSNYGCPQYFTYMLDDFEISDRLMNNTCSLSSSVHVVPCKSVDLVRAALDLMTFYDVREGGNQWILPTALVKQESRIEAHWYFELLTARLLEEMNQLDGNSDHEKLCANVFENILLGEGIDHDNEDQQLINSSLHELYRSVSSDEMVHLTKNPMWKSFPQFKQSPIVPLMLRHTEGVPHLEEDVINITEDDRKITRCVEDFELTITVVHPVDGTDSHEVNCTASELGAGKAFSVSCPDGDLSFSVKGSATTVDGFGNLAVGVTNTGSNIFSVTGLRAVASVKKTVDGAVSQESETYSEGCYQLCIPDTSHTFNLDMPLALCIHVVKPEPVDPNNPPNPGTGETPAPVPCVNLVASYVRILDDDNSVVDIPITIDNLIKGLEFTTPCGCNIKLSLHQLPSTYYDGGQNRWSSPYYGVKEGVYPGIVLRLENNSSDKPIHVCDNDIGVYIPGRDPLDRYIPNIIGNGSSTWLQPNSTTDVGTAAPFPWRECSGKMPSKYAPPSGCFEPESVDLIVGWYRGSEMTETIHVTGSFSDFQSGVSFNIQSEITGIISVSWDYDVITRTPVLAFPLTNTTSVEYNRGKGGLKIYDGTVTFRKRGTSDTFTSSGISSVVCGGGTSIEGIGLSGSATTTSISICDSPIAIPKPPGWTDNNPPAEPPTSPEKPEKPSVGKPCVDPKMDVRIKLVPSTFPAGVEYWVNGSIKEFLSGKTFRTRDGLYSGKITLRVDDDGSDEPKIIAVLNNTTVGNPYMSGGNLVLWELWVKYEILEYKDGKISTSTNERSAVSLTVVPPKSEKEHPPLRLPMNLCSPLGGTQPDEPDDLPVIDDYKGCWKVRQVVIKDENKLVVYKGPVGGNIQFKGFSITSELSGSVIKFKAKKDPSLRELPSIGIEVTLKGDIAASSNKMLTKTEWLSYNMNGVSINSSGYAEFGWDLDDIYKVSECTGPTYFKLFNGAQESSCPACALQALTSDTPTTKPQPTVVQQKLKKKPKQSSHVESNWWAQDESYDSNVQVRGYVSSHNAFLVLKADSAPHWHQPHFVPNATLFWGQITPSFDVSNGVWKGWRGHNALFGSTSQKSFSDFSPTSRRLSFREMANPKDDAEAKLTMTKDYLQEELKRELYSVEVTYARPVPSVFYPCYTYEVSADRAFSPLFKNYNHDPSCGDGLHDVIIREDTYHADFQSHSLSWNVPVNAGPLAENEHIAMYDGGLEYERTGGRADKNSFAYHVQPSKYNGMVNASPIKVIHPHYGEVGWFEGALATPPFTMVSDDELESNHTDQCGFRVDLNYQNVTSVFSPLTFPKDAPPYPCVEVPRVGKKIPEPNLLPPPPDVVPNPDDPTSPPSTADPGGLSTGLKILIRWEDATKTNSIYPWGAVVGALYLQLESGNTKCVPLKSSGYKDDKEGYSVVCYPAYQGSIQEHNEVLKGTMKKTGVQIGSSADMADEYLKSYYSDLPNEFVLNFFGDRVKKVGIVVYRYPKLPYSMEESYKNGSLPVKYRLTQPIHVDVVKDTHGYPTWLSTRNYGKSDCTLLKRWVVEPDLLNNLGGKASGKSAVFVGTIEGKSNGEATFTDKLTPVGSIDYLSTFNFLGW